MEKMPPKTRDIKNHHMDSAVWNDFVYRLDDIVIASYIKSGITWLQQIISQLIFDGAENLPVAQISPWLDLRFPDPKEKLLFLEKQKHRRFIKTHLPADALVLSEKVKYLFIVRDGRDIVWSMYPHYLYGNDLMYKALNDTPGRIGPSIQRPSGPIKDYFNEWLEKDGFPIWSFWENVKSWWDLKDYPNVKLLHYNNLKKDISKEIRNIASFLSIRINENNWEKILEHCSFEYMKNHADEMVPLEGALWEGGGKTFIYKGTNNRWKDELTLEENQKYESMAKEKLGEECAHWLATGEL